MISDLDLKIPDRADVIIVGGGPAGLSCGLVLGRSRRKVIIFDTGLPRNRFSRAMHGFLSRDGEDPRIFLEKGRAELKKYKIRLKRSEVIRARKVKDGFLVETAGQEHYFARKLVLATGITDQLPDLKGIHALYGKSVFHCPYCDGWEFRDRHWLVYAANPKAAVEICLRYKSWTHDITLLAAYCDGLGKKSRQLLLKNGIRIVEGRVAELSGKNGLLEHAVFANGERIKAEALFFSSRQQKPEHLTEQLGCACNSKGAVRFNRHQQTNVPGLYVAGDLGDDMQLVMIAAAEGAKAAVVINTMLNREARRA